MHSFWNMVGGGIAVFLIFAGFALFYWVMSKIDREEEKEDKP